MLMLSIAPRRYSSLYDFSHCSSNHFSSLGHHFSRIFLARRFWPEALASLLLVFFFLEWNFATAAATSFLTATSPFPSISFFIFFSSFFSSFFSLLSLDFLAFLCSLSSLMTSFLTSASSRPLSSVLCCTMSFIFFLNLAFVLESGIFLL